MPLLAREDWDAAGSASPPSWELPLIGLSFAGFGLGLAVAAPLYAKQRWPDAFAGLLLLLLLLLVLGDRERASRR
ncbi:hypothetical protein HS041_01125 [Planomonospora sp. ID67723]|uniref:hypothetical protein n=1 Tax=Planomonospora sp. ID67723 TaxID=2738134 RepID=UPI0018C42B81|nr:hypothetical protein [Planomonospora sp. ID67723]MBG0826385.1 hypothetical protein [Planomonospora sp. ID67723]